MGLAFKKNIFKSKKLNNPVSPELELCRRSLNGEESELSNTCVNILNTFCYVDSSSYPFFQTGDYVYNTNDYTSPFNGENKFFRITYDLDETDRSYIIQIGSDGFITYLNECLGV